MKIVIRILVIGTAALVIGVIANQMHDHGIPWKVLRLSLPLKGSQNTFLSVSTDSSFSFHLDPIYQFIDIREKALFDIDHISRSRSCPFNKIFRDGIELPDSLRKMPVVIVDSFRYSRNAELTAKYLCNEGFENVMIMHGGFIEWLDRGYPVESGEE